jgi:hypothetical protein
MILTLVAGEALPSNIAYSCGGPAFFFRLILTFFAAEALPNSLRIIS